MPPPRKHYYTVLLERPVSAPFLFRSHPNDHTMSPSSKGSPHSGQNLGGLTPFSGSQPHLSHLYWGTPAGFFAPHSGQNLPLFTAPQAQVQPAGSSGFLVPHSGQNLPVTDAPQPGHVQPAAAGLGSGFFAPHSGQNLPVAVAPQAQVQLLAAGAAGAGAGAGAG